MYQPGDDLPEDVAEFAQNRGYLQESREEENETQAEIGCEPES